MRMLLVWKFDVCDGNYTIFRAFSPLHRASASRLSPQGFHFPSNFKNSSISLFYCGFTIVLRRQLTFLSWFLLSTEDSKHLTIFLLFIHVIITRAYQLKIFRMLTLLLFIPTLYFNVIAIIMLSTSDNSYPSTVEESYIMLLYTEDSSYFMLKMFCYLLMIVRYNYY